MPRRHVADVVQLRSLDFRKEQGRDKWHTMLGHKREPRNEVEFGRKEMDRGTRSDRRSQRHDEKASQASHRKTRNVMMPAMTAAHSVHFTAKCDLWSPMNASSCGRSRSLVVSRPTSRCRPLRRKARICSASLSDTRG